MARRVAKRLTRKANVLVTKDNILQQILLTKYGNWSSKSKTKLRQELIDYWGAQQQPPISRQAVSAWFDRGSIPSRGLALRFVYDFFTQSIQRGGFAPGRKRVYGNVIAFLERVSALESRSRTLEPAQSIQTTKAGVLIRYKIEASDLQDLSNTLAGVFLAYRYRFKEDVRRPISREVLRVFREADELRFELWYLREDSRVDRFQGVVLPIGNLLWFIGATKDEPRRLRVMHFLHAKTHNVRYNYLRWGIASSDIPVPASADPAAARICLMKLEGAETDQNFDVESKPAYLELQELKREQHGTVVLRLIDNRTTAESEHGSIAPKRREKSQQQIEDPVLKVDQTTIQNASDAIFDKIDWSKGS